MTTPLKANVVVADDHAMLRESVAEHLDSQPDLSVVAQAGDGIAALEAVLHEEIHLAVLDISMPRMTGIDVARHIREQRPGTRVLFLSMHDSDDLVFRALEAGASGYVLKSAAMRDLLEAARAALRGEVFLYPASVRRLAETFLRDDADRRDPLSPRELEVLKLVAEGYGNAEIGRLLMISPRTVARHRANTLAKLGMTDRVELTRYAIRRGLVAP